MFQFEQILILGQSLIGFGDLKLVWGPLSDVTRNSSELPARLGPVGLALGSALGAWFEFWLLRKHVVAKWEDYCVLLDCASTSALQQLHVALTFTASNSSYN